MASIHDAGPPATGLGAEMRQLLVLAAPLALTQFGQHFMTVIDTAMLGRYHEASMAGAGIAGGIYFAVAVVGVGTMLGLDALVPQAIGAGQPSRADTFYRAGLRLAALLAIPLALAMAIFALLLPRGGLDPAVAAEAKTFLLWRIPGLYPFLVIVAQRSYLQAHHLTRPIVLAMVIGNALNVVFDYVLIFGDPGLARLGLPGLGLPPLGATGAAIATSLVSIAGAVYLAGAMSHVRQPGAPPVAADLRRVANLGLPVGLHLLAEVGVFALALYVAGRLRGHAAAGHQVAISLASLSFSLALGIGAAAAVRVGRAIGAGDTPAARRAATASFVVGMLAMGSFGLVFAVIPGALASVFTHSEAVIAAAAPLIQIAAVFQLSDSLQAVGAGVLRGVGDTRATFVANVIGHYAIGLPVALVLAFPGRLGAPGLWWGLTAGLTAVAGFLVIRFYRLSARPIAALVGPAGPAGAAAAGHDPVDRPVAAE